jgi:hypothetical protein
MGLRWLPDITQRDATQTTSLGANFEKELAEAQLAEEARSADETRLPEAAVAKLKAEAALAAAPKVLIRTGNETYTRAENVNTTPVLSGTEEAWRVEAVPLPEAEKRVAEATKNVVGLQSQVTEAKVAWQAGAVEAEAEAATNKSRYATPNISGQAI